MNVRKLLIRSVIALSLCAVAGYAYFEARQFLAGPCVTVTSPSDGFIVSDSPIIVSGNAQHISEITLSGNIIFVDEKGQFEQLVPLSPGYSVIEIKVKDRYGRYKNVYLRGIYKPEITYEMIIQSNASTTIENSSSTDSLHTSSIDETIFNNAL